MCASSFLNKKKQARFELLKPLLQGVLLAYNNLLFGHFDRFQFFCYFVYANFCLSLLQEGTTIGFSALGSI